jgi:hypothetical protein
MSYDLSIGDAEFNYTYNLSGLFHKHIHNGADTGLGALCGMTGRQAAIVLQAAFESIHREYMDPFRSGARITCIDADRILSDSHTPENGWGSYTSALIFLGRLLGACAANPRSKIKVY